MPLTILDGAYLSKNGRDKACCHKCFYTDLIAVSPALRSEFGFYKTVLVEEEGYHEGKATPFVPGNKLCLA